MNLIEISCPAEAIDNDQRRAIADTVIANLLVHPDAPKEALERAGRTTHVWFHDALGWTSGGGEWKPDAAVPFVVTITVPEAWREELARHAMAAVRVALTRYAGNISLTDESTWINVVGVQDGSIGMNGHRTTSADIVRHLTDGIQTPGDSELPPGVVIDPVCGMRVHLGPNAITLDHDGRTVGFCATGCQLVYAEDHGLDLSPAER